ncbi:hypothetical protein EDB85DRAFT_2143111 [Lactarius pseudohatsudake]|nr:hypothetical protein EDB85DRAFT_2143111 [Lactarius pseudohatsudake]
MLPYRPVSSARCDPASEDAIRAVRTSVHFLIFLPPRRIWIRPPSSSRSPTSVTTPVRYTHLEAWFTLRLSVLLYLDNSCSMHTVTELDVLSNVRVPCTGVAWTPTQVRRLAILIDDTSTPNTLFLQLAAGLSHLEALHIVAIVQPYDLVSKAKSISTTGPGHLSSTNHLLLLWTYLSVLRRGKPYAAIACSHRGLQRVNGGATFRIRKCCWRWGSMHDCALMRWAKPPPGYFTLLLPALESTEELDVRTRRHTRVRSAQMYGWGREMAALWGQDGFSVMDITARAKE